MVSFFVVLRVVFCVLLRLLQYGISKVLITAHEVLTAYQLLMQQAEYSAQMGSSRFVSSRLFDRLLSLNLTDMYVRLDFSPPSLASISFGV